MSAADDNIRSEHWGELAAVVVGLMEISILSTESVRCKSGQCPMNPNPSTDPEHWVDQYGDGLFRYALLRLRDPELAEDVVQETFLAGLQAREKFAGRSSEGTWLVGILKHKIIDHIRKTDRERSFSDMESSADTIENLFDEKGKWKVEPPEWAADPSMVFEQKEFWEVLERCLSDLPSRLCEAFSLRAMDGLSSEEICRSYAEIWNIIFYNRLW